MNKSSLILGTQSSALAVHICLNYFFVNVYKCDMVGCAFATFLTYSFIYFVNRWKLSRQSDISDALEVSILDPQVRRNLFGYLEIGLPSMITLIIEFISYEVTVIYLGQIGIENQAT